VIIRQLNRASACAAAPDGGSDGSVITAQRVEPVQLELSCRTEEDGSQVISVTGELDIATAEQAYAYISDVIDCWPAPVSVDLAGLTFCDASGLGALARVARHARQTGRPLKVISARPSLVKIMRITGLDRTFPELRPSVGAYW
jgi:anti-sigma B factor antagonist